MHGTLKKRPNFENLRGLTNYFVLYFTLSFSFTAEPLIEARIDDTDQLDEIDTINAINGRRFDLFPLIFQWDSAEAATAMDHLQFHLVEMTWFRRDHLKNWRNLRGFNCVRAEIIKVRGSLTVSVSSSRIDWLKCVDSVRDLTEFYFSLVKSAVNWTDKPSTRRIRIQFNSIQWKMDAIEIELDFPRLNQVEWESERRFHRIVWGLQIRWSFIELNWINEMKWNRTPLKLNSPGFKQKNASSFRWNRLEFQIQVDSTETVKFLWISIETNWIPSEFHEILLEFKSTLALTGWNSGKIEPSLTQFHPTSIRMNEKFTHLPWNSSEFFSKSVNFHQMSTNSKSIPPNFSQTARKRR